MRRTIAKASFHTALNLLFFASIGTALLALTHDLTDETIAQSEQREKLKLIAQIVSPDSYDNNIVQDTQLVPADELLGTQDTTLAYLGKLGGKPSVAVLEIIAPDGYSGKIKLLIAIHSDGRVGGVRVIAHKETPGLGDYIEIAKSSWITGFNNTSISNHTAQDWQVKKDGGTFDYMAGATITPRAVVKAVHHALQYFAQHRAELFTPPPTQPGSKK